MVKKPDAAIEFGEVEIERLTTLKGGLLKKPIALSVKTFHAGGAEFVHLTKGEQWLISAAVGAMERQRGLQRSEWNLNDDCKWGPAGLPFHPR